MTETGYQLAEDFKEQRRLTSSDIERAAWNVAATRLGAFLKGLGELSAKARLGCNCAGMHDCRCIMDLDDLVDALERRIGTPKEPRG